ncbi:hypothetical protein Dimus_000387, partial [Dionaea muscipula]
DTNTEEIALRRCRTSTDRPDTLWPVAGRPRLQGQSLCDRATSSSSPERATAEARMTMHELSPQVGHEARRSNSPGRSPLPRPVTSSASMPGQTSSSFIMTAYAQLAAGKDLDGQS